MAYYNAYPYGQQQMYQPYQYQQNLQQPQDDRIWVQGEAAAASYLVAANNVAHLWDSTQPVVYEKQSDVTGRPLPMVIYDLRRRDMTAPAPNGIEEKLNAMEERIKALESRGAVTSE